MTEKLIEKIRKYKPLKHAPLSKIKAEVLKIAEYMKNPLLAEARMYNIHEVPVNGIDFKVADAKVPNRHTNQSGRGNLRYLVDKITNQYAGLALEISDGSYRKVA